MLTLIRIAILRWIAKHHDRLTRSLGAQVLAAQERQQWDGMADMWRKREHHRQKRDVLTLKASSLERRASNEDHWLHADGETCPPCMGNCNQGDCLGSVNASRAALGMRPLDAAREAERSLWRRQRRAAITTPFE